MKNGLGREAVTRLSEALFQTCPDFDGVRFEREALAGLEELELKERVSHLIEVLHGHLPEDFEAGVAVLRKIPPQWDFGAKEDPLAGFAAWPLIDYVGIHGLDHPQQALSVLKILTPLFSAEFAVRPFLEKHTELTLSTFSEWCGDSDAHVRRLVSEGSRPRLPWGSHLQMFRDDPAPVITLLEELKDDPSDYVRRSVANNLNDISKDHPERVLELCRCWIQTSTKERKWIVRHATRTLVKSGNPAVFPLLGCTPNPSLSTSNLRITPKKIRMGDSVEFSVEISSRAKTPQTFVVDYAMHLMKKNGATQPKVFKLKTIRLAPLETILVQKCHRFRPVTTRVYYSGKQAVEFLVNGVPVTRQSFWLDV